MRTFFGIVFYLAEDLVMWVYEKVFGDDLDREIELINEDLRRQAEGL